MESTRDEAGVLDHWAARKIQPRVVAYVTAVFAAFMAVAHFLLHSPTGVEALAIAAISALIPLLMGVVAKVEYRLTESGVKKRPLKEKEPAQFKPVFRWEELSHIVPVKHGFKYFLTVDDSNPIRRFWKAHLSETVSGEVHLEEGDQERIIGILSRRGIPLSKPACPPSIPSGDPRGSPSED